MVRDNLEKRRFVHEARQPGRVVLRVDLDIGRDHKRPRLGVWPRIVDDIAKLRDALRVNVRAEARLNGARAAELVAKGHRSHGVAPRRRVAQQRRRIAPVPSAAVVGAARRRGLGQPAVDRRLARRARAPCERIHREEQRAADGAAKGGKLRPTLKREAAVAVASSQRLVLHEAAAHIAAPIHRVCLSPFPAFNANLTSALYPALFPATSIDPFTTPYPAEAAARGRGRVGSGGRVTRAPPAALLVSVDDLVGERAAESEVEGRERLCGRAQQRVVQVDAEQRRVAPRTAAVVALVARPPIKRRAEVLVRHLRCDGLAEGRGHPSARALLSSARLLLPLAPRRSRDAVPPRRAAVRVERRSHGKLRRSSVGGILEHGVATSSQGACRVVGASIPCLSDLSTRRVLPDAPS
eukprot:3454187-Pleurochrysis_carterae.AAC.7